MDDIRPSNAATPGQHATRAPSTGLSQSDPLGTLDSAFLKRYDLPGPRYTSYPPATAFNAQFGAAQLQQALEASNGTGTRNLSLYVHIPFCPQRCTFCGCNTDIGADDALFAGYVDALLRELDTVTAPLDLTRPLTQIHWGGGTPNSLPRAQATRLMEGIRRKFRFATDAAGRETAEVAVECSPAYLSLEDLEFWAKLGFNRMSLGIQDFHPHILESINRLPPRLPVPALVAELRRLGFRGINLDLVYGLPGQDLGLFRENLERTVEANPDRIATFSYAHVPWAKGHQKSLEKLTLPGPDEKMSMLLEAVHFLGAQGYDTIGMDHFARPDDALARALATGTLHRNFQGYCTRETTGQVVAIGASGISQLATAYAQDQHDTQAYLQSVAQTGWAVERGYTLSREEQVIRSVIEAVMCAGRLDWEQAAAPWGLTGAALKDLLRPDEKRLEQFAADGLVSLDASGLQVTPRGFLVVRVIAMTLDPLLLRAGGRFSQTI